MVLVSHLHPQETGKGWGDKDSGVAGLERERYNPPETSVGLKVPSGPTWDVETNWKKAWLPLPDGPVDGVERFLLSSS